MILVSELLLGVGINENILSLYGHTKFMSIAIFDQNHMVLLFVIGDQLEAEIFYCIGSGIVQNLVFYVALLQ